MSGFWFGVLLGIAIQALGAKAWRYAKSRGWV